MTQTPFRSTSQEATLNSNGSEALRGGVSLTQPSALETKTGIGAQLTENRSATLGRQLLTTVLPLALAPLAVASVTGYTITQNRSQTQVNSALEGQALLVGEGASQAVADNLNVMAGVATSPLIANSTSSATDIVEAENLIERPVDVLEVEFSNTKLVRPEQALNSYLERLTATQGFAAMVLTERNGLNVAYSNIPTGFVQYRDTWWQQGKARTQWVSDPQFDESSQTFGLALAQRIDDASTGEFLGVLNAFVSSQSFEFLSAYLQNAGISGSQQVQLLDVGSGAAIATYTADGLAIPESSNDALVVTGGRTVTEIAAQLIEAVRSTQAPSVEEFETTLRAAYPVDDLRVSQATETEAGQGLLITFRFEGKQYTMSTVPQLDWVAIASMNISEIRAAGRDLLSIFSLIAVVLGGIATAVTIGLSGRLASPLIDLSDKARQVSAGNLNVSADPRGTAETQTLAQTFNDLVTRVKGFLSEQTLNARRATLFSEITGAKVTSSEELVTVFDQVVTEARTLLEADRVVVYQFDALGNGTVASEAVDANLPTAHERSLIELGVSDSMIDQFYANETLAIDNVNTAEFPAEHRQLLKQLAVQSVLAVPITGQDRLYGLVVVHHCRTSHAWLSAEVDFTKQLGLQVGLVVERIQLLEQTEALAEEQRQLKEGLQRNALQLLMDVDPVSRGDLTVRAKVTEDEIGTIADSYNAMIASLRKIVSQVKTAAEQVAVNTETSDKSVRAMSTSAMQQAAEISAALDQAQEMANSVRQVAANARKAELAVQQASQTVQEGDAAMNRTVDGIMAIRETVAETAKKVKRLGESSQKISNVVNLISGFAAQTNMLALNASIEASRAGEGGKGFAVVAEEVRELARQSAEATTEIEKLVAGIQAETNDVVLAMEAGTEQVVNGTELVDETRQSLNRITAASQQISQLVEAITTVTVAQSQASEAVTASMTSVAAIATQNSKDANQVSGTFAELNAVAQALQEEVGQFKIG